MRCVQCNADGVSFSNNQKKKPAGQRTCLACSKTKVVKAGSHAAATCGRAGHEAAAAIDAAAPCVAGLDTRAAVGAGSREASRVIARVLSAKPCGAWYAEWKTKSGPGHGPCEPATTTAGCGDGGTSAADAGEGRLCAHVGCGRVLTGGRATHQRSVMRARRVASSAR